MPGSSAEQFFDKAFPLANNLIMKVSSAPENEAQLFRLIETAMLRGFDTQAPLKEIHLPLERFPSVDSKFWHVPIEDCGPAPVLRLFFEPAAEAPL
jgi:hypothetical protein